MQTLNRWILSAYIIIAALTGLLIKYVTEGIWDAAGIAPLMRGALRIGDLGGIAVAILLLILFIKNEKIQQFAGEVYAELSKVTWPERKETILSAGVITVMVGISAAILFGFDALWGAVVKLFY